uniref:Uncharacterized protein n=1 Tax=Graphocephala atropunctata TaxID=36148 RepID=A0A1B6MG56_9HEMI
MSSQRGNVSRTRPQKHKNSRVFKNNLHDKSKKTQIINSITVTDTCNRCKAIIEWKIKYKKYKQLKSAKTCIKCSNKTVKQSYHTICGLCVKNLKVCAKCGTNDFNNNNSTSLPKEEDECSNQDSGLSDEDSECGSDSS